MRVIAGSKKGHPLQAVPGKSTRPTVDKVKEAIFSMIGPYFEGGLVLDLYAGTGGLGIEALSRGAERCIFIDANRKAVHVIFQNLGTTGLRDQAEVYRNDANRALNALKKRKLSFRIVFLDPPYAEQQIESQIAMMIDYRLLAPGAVIVAEHDAKDILCNRIGGVVKIKEVTYGQTTITIYKNEG
ncbi:16S rRNA (guanine(966)-N(2))-methyltransferase RsmD [Aneurinibacillus thermoaerophilus]|uniref:16S rRNA (Guanine(966)-N(2))-methyltransferase RsmD n=1 Tax=Aneurinibacillus thermoaerophilus TaxID=143495 RepID=A0A1G7WBZ3_ANETH|nr:16S rRNA (guanine(966)-N(2))-methyltransferase RsmD [Aneurinibacillus thermoaerophilus]MED0756743.1 16S rRNA (guanine(966)-N(2))-methyltransferase RsmD [Aneurinibacillus thermoaerophilus]MED0760793.1 16S rRNA (guanine(966)-N(2))-methyltransferase RsmD [Aneurinibacillus thermoaerophilus]SDG69319.1 16S rRNA (guanine(966)-N(2))-methyltransferase RsmD [Aneurinibacillus thermoaerophilus]